jgi:subtilisin family serine protease
VRIALLDTGVDASHPDLTVEEGCDFTASPSGWADAQGHGTHCAGIIAARDNSLGVVGAAPAASLLAGKVLGDNGSGTIEGIAAGIDWAVSRGVDVISMSLGGDGPVSGVMRAAIDRAIAAGIIVVVAAGNSGPYPRTVGSPGNYTPCVTVAATDSSNNVARFSSRGVELDVAAPGVNIMSTYPGGRYTALSGTSMATPYVAGIAALFCQLAKSLGVQPRQQLFESYATQTALDLGAPGKDTSYGYGLIQPKALLAKLAGDNVRPTPPPPAPSPPAPPAPEQPGMKLKLVLADGRSMVVEGVVSISTA